MFPEWTVDKAKVLEQQQFPVGLQPVQGFIPEKFKIVYKKIPTVCNGQNI